MSVPSQPAINTFQNPAKLCQKYEKEIGHLRKELAMYDTLTNRNQVNYEPLSDVQIRDIRQQVRKYLDNDISDIEVINLRQVQEVFAQFKYFVESVEKEGERRLKEKYTMLEKNDPIDNSTNSCLKLYFHLLFPFIGYTTTPFLYPACTIRWNDVIWTLLWRHLNVVLTWKWRNVFAG